MIEIEIPGWRVLRLANLVLDFNGTLARDGLLLAGVRSRMDRLAGALAIHVVTGDTFGTARAQLDTLPCHTMLLVSADQDLAKGRIVQELGAARTAAIGNGRNDCHMLKTAALGIAVLGAEGTAAETVMAADLVVRSPTTALDLLLNPRRLVASLRR